MAKIFRPEPEKSSSTLRIVILLILLLSITGIAAFKLYFMPKHDAETGLFAAKQIDTSAPDKKDRDEYIPESITPHTTIFDAGIKEKPVSETDALPQALPDSPMGSINREGIDYAKKGGYQKPSKDTEDKIEKGFQKKEGTHFAVKFEGGENSDIGYLTSILLEEAYIKVGFDIGYYPEDRIEVVLYTQQQFTDVTRAPNWAGAIYDGRIKIRVGGITSRTNLLERVLFHEYTHALVHRISGNKTPSWLNEGLAEYEEGAIREDINRILAQLAKSEKLILLRPFERPFNGFNKEQTMIAYSVSLSAIEYIINEFGMPAVRRILENLGEGKTIEEAVSSSLYISYEDLQGVWFMSLKKKFAG